MAVRGFEMWEKERKGKERQGEAWKTKRKEVNREKGFNLSYKETKGEEKERKGKCGEKKKKRKREA